MTTTIRELWDDLKPGELPTSLKAAAFAVVAYVVVVVGATLWVKKLNEMSWKNHENNTPTIAK